MELIKVAERLLKSFEHRNEHVDLQSLTFKLSHFIFPSSNKKMIYQTELTLPPFRRGFHLITDTILNHLQELPDRGLLHVFIKHTSAGLTINENADPTVRQDFETVFNRLVPEQAGYVHDDEGPDDMPAHIKSTLCGASVMVPVTHKRLNLGTWQGIYLCEFRNDGGSRKIILTVHS